MDDPLSKNQLHCRVLVAKGGGGLKSWKIVLSNKDVALPKATICGYSPISAGTPFNTLKLRLFGIFLNFSQAWSLFLALTLGGSFTSSVLQQITKSEP
jgi:hypothetical protein